MARAVLMRSSAQFHLMPEPTSVIVLCAFAPLRETYGFRVCGARVAGDADGDGDGFGVGDAAGDGVVSGSVCSEAGILDGSGLSGDECK